jgi:hypothetical protein
MILGLFSCNKKEEPDSTESLYALAVSAGFEGSYDDWLKALMGTAGEKGEKGDKGENGDQGEKGDVGDKGLSAYELYCKYHPAYSGTEEEWINALADGSLMASYKTHYNIIFTLATIPPVLSSLDAIESGYETYACIERGKTYNGIGNLSKFHNVSFDIKSNQSSGFTEEQFDAMVEQIKKLNVFGNETFHIYVQDATGFAGFSLAANAQLSSSQYDITLCEDGTGAYYYLEQAYIKDKKVTASVDEPYDTFMAEAAKTQEMIDTILSKTDNNYGDYSYDINRAATYSVIDKVTYWYQDYGRLEDLLKTTDNGTSHSKLLSVFGINGYNDEVELKADLRFESISEAVEKLSEQEKTSYLQLMYGSAYEGTYNALTRTTLSDGVTRVPESKLVFIGSRVKNCPQLVSDGEYGVGGLGDTDTVPQTYDELPAKYKTSLIFGTKADYDLFLSQINDPSNYTSTQLSNETLNKIHRAFFNYYVDYIYLMKFTYSLYGDSFDIIVKGHPSEALGNHTEWTSPYSIDDYKYDKLVDNAIISFHANDSIGRFIGTVPYGTAAENLAYLGTNMAICGLPSSTYTGYEPDVDVKFVLNLIDGDITADTNLKARYEAGNLKNHDKQGNACDTEFYNIGNFYKALVAHYTSTNELESAQIFKEKLNDWLRKVNSLNASADVTGYGVDAQGKLIVPNANR